METGLFGSSSCPPSPPSGLCCSPVSPLELSCSSPPIKLLTSPVLHTIKNCLQGPPAPQLVRGANKSKTNKSCACLLNQPQSQVVGRTPQGPGIQVGAVLFLVQPAFTLPGAAGTADKRSTRRVHLGCEATMTAPKLL